MSNILNHNRTPFELTLCKRDYWDFHLVEGMGGGPSYPTGLTTECLSVYINLDDTDCIWYDNLISKSGYIWDNYKNHDRDFCNIGMTGIDNGLFLYQKDRITNADFLNIFFNSTFSTDQHDNRLVLHPVGGNTGKYQYPYRIMTIDNRIAVELKGGFFQGFFSDADNEYKILPTALGRGWVMETVLKPCRFDDLSTSTLNYSHPENKGIFLFIGARAENKWYRLYDAGELDNQPAGWETDYMTETPDVTGNYFSDNYYDDPEYFGDEYFLQYKEKKTAKVMPDYINDDYVAESLLTDRFVADDYVEDELSLPSMNTIQTTDGYTLGQPNIKEIVSDNKFLSFNHTKDGFTTKSWNEGDTIHFSYIETPQVPNYFTLFHHGSDGYTTKNIDTLLNVLNKKYDVMSDLYRNALAFQVTDNGAVRYKYLVKDCDGGADYKIESETTADNVVDVDVWHTISVALIPIRPVSVLQHPNCEPSVRLQDKMRISIYVDGKLRLLSKELPILNLRRLNDLSTRQEGVPFNISLGGGTQGLCDVVYTDYMALPKDVLPMEKEFGGTFEGFLSQFRFYTCPIDFSSIFMNSFSDTRS